MKIRVLSDLHLEFMGDRWERFVDEFQRDADVLVLAGDIHTAEIVRVLRVFSRRFDNVVFVAGNHEFYGSSVTDTLKVLDTISAHESMSNVHWLERGIVRIGSVGQTGRARFLGTTLWFCDPPIPGPYQSDLRRGLADYAYIKGFEPWVYEQNKLSLAWLHENVQRGDVVVTHHLPGPRSTHPKYIGSPMNRFFLGTMTLELEQLIRERQPAVWIHGHTHESMDYRIGETRVVCNPYGYYGQETNAAFDPGFTVEVDT